MSGTSSSGCVLDSCGCVSLDKILKSFGAPISEEQAWALSYAFAECCVALRGTRRRKFMLVTSLKHVVLHKDGFVHEKTFLPDPQIGRSRSRAASEGKLVTELGVVLYRALDYTLGNEEERDLSPSLYKLIDLMTSAEAERGETDDEGIEKDSGESEDEQESSSANFTMSEILKICQERLVADGVNEGVEEHYRAVVRALVTEAVDLNTFLQKVALGAKFAAIQSDLLSSEQDLHQLQCEDWARLWKQVMRDLRNGVKLKKVEYTKTPLEYALTPYEMLMEDIRSRRYTLNKVMVNGDIPPRVKKDAHTIILDFIRSRPPLRKASDRKLPPRSKILSPMELLMDSIKNHDHRLKHVATPVRSKPLYLVHSSQSLSHDVSSSQPRRKLIAAPRLNLSAEDEDDDDDLSDIPPSSPRLSGGPLLSGPLSSATHTHASLTATPTSPRSPASPPLYQSKENLSSPLSRVAYDLANYGSAGVPGRRHSITICETPHGGSCSRDGSPRDTPGPPSRGSPTHSPSKPFYASTSKTQRDFLSSAHFSTRLDCLSLTLEEVVHIRNVLTKVDLDSLPLDLSIKEDVAKGKMCFLCMKTRFGFFGPRSRECRLCKRFVCKKCVTKMRIPTEHFSNIPVIMLTPQALSPREEEDEQGSISKTFLNMLQEFPRPGQERRSSVSGSVGSAPSSPVSSPRSSRGPVSLPAPPAPCVTQDIKNRRVQRSLSLYKRSVPSIPEEPSFHRIGSVRKQELRQRNQEIEERLRGELMAVCLDCKAMVIHVLLSIKLTRDQQMQQSSPSQQQQSAALDASCDTSRGHLHLNLTPVYN